MSDTHTPRERDVPPEEQGDDWALNALRRWTNQRTALGPRHYLAYGCYGAIGLSVAFQLLVAYLWEDPVWFLVTTVVAWGVFALVAPAAIVLSFWLWREWPLVVLALFTLPVPWAFLGSVPVGYLVFYLVPLWGIPASRIGVELVRRRRARKGLLPTRPAG